MLYNKHITFIKTVKPWTISNIITITLRNNVQIHFLIYNSKHQSPTNQRVNSLSPRDTMWYQGPLLTMIEQGLSQMMRDDVNP